MLNLNKPIRYLYLLPHLLLQQVEVFLANINAQHDNLKEGTLTATLFAKVQRHIQSK